MIHPNYQFPDNAPRALYHLGGLLAPYASALNLAMDIDCHQCEPDEAQLNMGRFYALHDGGGYSIHDRHEEEKSAYGLSAGNAVSNLVAWAERHHQQLQKAA